MQLGNKEVSSLSINDKEVQSIKRVSDDAIIYEKALPEPSLVLGVTGSSFKEHNSSTGLIGDNKIVDYGDGTIEPLNGRLSHTYNDGISSHEIKIYNVISLKSHCFSGCTGLTSITIHEGVTNLGSSCFYNCTGLTSITIPDSVTILNSNCFGGCTSLTSITLNWTGADILTYDSSWVTNANSNLKFKIPAGIKQLYIDKDYPEDKLEEYYLYAPSFTADNPTPTAKLDNGYQVSQSNGELTLIGGCISDGWSNEGLWECDYDVKWNGTRYQRFITLMALPSVPLLGGWEGCIATPQSDLGSNVQRDNTDCLTVVHQNIWNNPSTPWIHINIKKTTPTTLVITKTGDTANNGTITFTNCDLLDSYERMSVGATSNNGSVIGKPTFKNFTVKRVL